MLDIAQSTWDWNSSNKQMALDLQQSPTDISILVHVLLELSFGGNSWWTGGAATTSENNLIENNSIWNNQRQQKVPVFNCILLHPSWSQGYLMNLRTEKLQCLKGEAAICGTRLLLVSRQVRAHLWHEVPARGLQWDLKPQLLNVTWGPP